MRTAVALLSLLVLAACASSDAHPVADASDNEQKSALARVTTPPSANVVASTSTAEIAFAFDLDGQLFRPGSNEVISPFSVNEVLAMTYAGAKGDAHDAIAKVLHVNDADADYEAAFGSVDYALTTNAPVDIAASIWADAGVIEPAFLDTMAVDFGAGVHDVSFGSPDAARGTINDWVSDHTAHAIPTLLPDGAISSLTKVVLVNALHFEGTWATALHAEGTGSFHAAAGDVSASWVDTSGTFSYAETDAVQAIALPYTTPGLSMLFVLPKAGGPSTLDAATYAAIVAALAPTGVAFGMPVVTLDSGSVDLRTPLSSLGMGPAFDGGDFSGMTAISVDLDSVVHEATITIDGNGTTASAGSAAVFGTKSIGPSVTTTMSLDHPYFFALRDEASGMILFLGHCEAPPASTN